MRNQKERKPKITWMNNDTDRRKMNLEKLLQATGNSIEWRTIVQPTLAAWTTGGEATQRNLSGLLQLQTTLLVL